MVEVLKDLPLDIRIEGAMLDILYDFYNIDEPDAKYEFHRAFDMAYNLLRWRDKDLGYLTPTEIVEFNQDLASLVCYTIEEGYGLGRVFSKRDIIRTEKMNSKLQRSFGLSKNDTPLVKQVFETRFFQGLDYSATTSDEFLRTHTVRQELKQLAQNNPLWNIKPL